MKNNLKRNLICLLSSISIGCACYGVGSLLTVQADTQDKIVYKSFEFTESFSAYGEMQVDNFATENVSVTNANFGTTSNGSGLIVDSDTVITTNMGYDEFDLYLTLSDDTSNGDANMRGPMITFANGSASVYQLYLAGNYSSVGCWLLKDGTVISPEWVMMSPATSLCKYKIEVREGSVGVKYWDETASDYVYSGFPMYLENSAISDISGYITMSHCENAKGTYTLNEMRVDPVAEDFSESITTPDQSCIELGAEGYVNIPLELNSERYVGAFINGNKVADEYVVLTKSNGFITNVAIDNEMFAFVYSKDTSMSLFDIAIISRDVKFSATAQYSIGSANVIFSDESDNEIKTVEIVIGTPLHEVVSSFDAAYVSYGINIEKTGIDGRTRNYLSNISDDYRIYKDEQIYCLTSSYQCDVYLYTYDNFSEWNDAKKVSVPVGMTIGEYIEMVNANDDPSDDIIVANPYGKLFTNWDYEGVITEDMDICAEYYELAQNGQDVNITFDSEPSATEMKSILAGGDVFYNGELTVEDGFVFSAFMSSQKYTNFEYTVDLKKMDYAYSDDWTFMFAFGQPNYNASYPSARKFGIAFKNIYDPETKSFSSQMLVQEGGDNITIYSANRMLALLTMKTRLFTSDAHIVEPVTVNGRDLWAYNSGLNEDNYVSFKIKVVDRTLTIYAKPSNSSEWTEEFSGELGFDTSGYITYLQPCTEMGNYSSTLSIDNINVKNLTNEVQEISLMYNNESYSTSENALVHWIGENEAGNDIVFNYDSRFQSFVGTTYMIYDADWNLVANGAKDFSVESINGEILKRQLTFSDKALSEIYSQYSEYAYGENKGINIVVRALTESDYADVYMVLNVKNSYRIYVQENADAENKVFAGAGGIGQALDLATFTTHFADYCTADAGYIFAGWKDLYEGIEYAGDETLNIYKNMTLIPYFTRVSYTVKFVDEEGTVFDEKTVLHGEDCELPTFIPESDKGKFVKWADDYKNVTSDRSVLAVFDDSGNDSYVEESGCKSSIDPGITVISLAFVATFIFRKKKKMI